MIDFYDYFLTEEKKIFEMLSTSINKDLKKLLSDCTKLIINILTTSEFVILEIISDFFNILKSLMMLLKAEKKHIKAF